MSEFLEIDVVTNKETYREYSNKELEQRNKDLKGQLDFDKAEQDKKTIELQNREAAKNHAKSLGFTDAMIEVLYPNLGAPNV